VSFDGRVVMAVNGFNGSPGDMSFSAEEVAVNAGSLTGKPGYFVGPLIPASAWINGQQAVVSMVVPPPAELLGLLPSTRVKLSWIPNPAGHQVTGYRIFKSSDRQGPFSVLDEVSGGGSSEYSDEDGIGAQGYYYYRIQALTQASDGLFSPVRIAMPMADLIGGYGPGMEDGEVDIDDQVVFSSYYGGPYSPEIDFNEDGQEDVSDFTIFGQWYGWEAR